MAKEIKNQKLAYNLAEISRLTKLDPKTIETWENELYFLNAGRTGGGKKIFRQKDLTIIIRLKELLESQGFTLAGAKRKIEQEFNIKGAAPVHSEKLKKILFQVRTQLKDIASDLENKA